ncbi:hypothetical protein BBBOND_0301620 [Babesia bigemina]|uniref:Uncharacterized protein n=1 Tax=Babesia bigemina TaxID=5866 RepID=A0A061D6U4_BABBI|nr:hypothetical protein BBBOND_0301620 [Babesia bigemina]CDR96258.1 hypothetical protein BBBOND_0301620 [Babesia bigemina]|eukprot:XP_012768444.1 hypothetical protein BBBOND_0301620 [Babesia bigemina]
MTPLRGQLFRAALRPIVLCKHGLNNANIAHFGTLYRKTQEQKTTATQKPKASDYFSRREIAALFLQPLFVIVVYLTVVWHGFKYYCNINSNTDNSHIQIDQFVSTLRWKYRAYRLKQSSGGE